MYDQHVTIALCGGSCSGKTTYLDTVKRRKYHPKKGSGNTFIPTTFDLYDDQTEQKIHFKVIEFPSHKIFKQMSNCSWPLTVDGIISMFYVENHPESFLEAIRYAVEGSHLKVPTIMVARIREKGYRRIRYKILEYQVRRTYREITQEMKCKYHEICTTENDKNELEIPFLLVARQSKMNLNF